MTEDLHTLSRAAMTIGGITPERIRRKVVIGEIDGRVIEGRYYVSSHGLEQLRALRDEPQPRPKRVTAGAGR
jgi:hypothetical protein